MTDFFICGPLYVRSSIPGRDICLAELQFRARLIDTVPGTDHRVAFGFRRWGDSGKWQPDHMGEEEFRTMRIKEES